MSQHQLVLEKCKRVLETASTLYNLDLSKVGIRFDLRGRAAGMACRRGTTYYIRFNHDMLGREAFDHLINDTVPHEIAHIVCFMNPCLGSNHNYGWEQVCRSLGGTGNRCHREEIVFARGKTFEYTTTHGNKIRISEQRHRRIQQGQVLWYRNNLGSINKECAYSIVGMQGRTLAEPVVKTKPATVVPPEPTPTPVTRVPVVAPIVGESKAAISRRIMLAGHTRGTPYDEIIHAMMCACGYSKQLAKATFKANAAKVGITNIG